MHSPPGDALGLDRVGMRPSEVRALYERTIEELRSVVDVLKGALAADNPALALHEGRPWLLRLTQQQRALVGALISRSPRVVPVEDLLEMLPSRDHVLDRQPKIIAVIVRNVRLKLGRGVICNVHGAGYFMPTAERDRLLSA